MEKERKFKPKIVGKDREIFKYRNYTAVLRKVRTFSGRIAEYFSLKRPDYVVIVAVTNSGKILVNREFRPPVGREILMFPAGTGERGVSPEKLARKELEEECGYLAKRTRLLGAPVLLSPGFTPTKVYLVLATGLSKSERNPEEDELITGNLELSEGRIRALINSGEFAHASSVIAFERFLGLRKKVTKKY